MMKKDIKNMEVAMDNLIMERKEIPTYMRNLYKWTWTPQPTMLKQDIHWDTQVLEKLDCPYCENDDSPKRILDNDDWDMIEIYISRGFLFVQSGDYDLFECKKINYCPMCGRPLK